MTAQTTEHKVDTLLGRVVVEQGLATEEEVRRCRAHQREQEQSGQGHDSLAELLVNHDIVTKGQIKRVLQVVDAHKSDRQIPGYQILEKLGSGAMASVYKAKQLSLDRVVAIKILPRKHTSDAAFVKRFYDEGKAAAKLNHSNIVQAFDVGQAGQFHYFVMEYVDGHTVFDHLQIQGRYGEGEALEVVVQIAKALHHAHEQGFVHRDVKPKNIMITKHSVAKLADMGLARQVSDREAAEAEAGRAFGTPYYISPEQIRGNTDIDFRADIYGLGGTFYHMVTGRVPFEASTPSAVMHKHLRQPLTPPDHLNTDLSAGVGEVIELMMAKNREQRYASTADLLEDLEAVAAGEPPLQARKRFNVEGLAALEAEAGVEGEQNPSLRSSMTEQPLFWFAAISAVLNLLLIVLLILAAG